MLSFADNYQIRSYFQPKDDKIPDLSLKTCSQRIILVRLPYLIYNRIGLISGWNGWKLLRTKKNRVQIIQIALFKERAWSVNNSCNQTEKIKKTTFSYFHELEGCFCQKTVLRLWRMKEFARVFKGIIVIFLSGA